MFTLFATVPRSRNNQQQNHQNPTTQERTNSTQPTTHSQRPKTRRQPRMLQNTKIPEKQQGQHETQPTIFGNSSVVYLHPFGDSKLSGPLIARYCDTIAAIPHIARSHFEGGSHSPKMVRCPPLVLSFTQAHLYDAPFCNTSRHNCAIPHKVKYETALR